MGARIVFPRGEAGERSLTLKPGRGYVLGRRRPADIVVRDTQVSRTHCKLETDPEGFWTVVDLDSSNGTRVNRNRVSRQRLRHGDVVGVGKTTFKFLDESVAATVAGEAADAGEEEEQEEIAVLDPTSESGDEVPVLAGADSSPSAPQEEDEAAGIAPSESPPFLANIPVGPAEPPPLSAQPEAREAKPAAARGSSARAWAAKLSPAGFAAVVLAFFLPFLHISCEGERLATFRGIDMVVGKKLEQSEELEDIGGAGDEGEQGGIEGLAVVAFVAALAGLVLGFFKRRGTLLGAAIAGGLGVLFLLLLRVKLASDFREFEGMVKLEYTVGYWLAMVLFLAAAGWHAFLYAQARQGAPARRPPVRSPG
ncbi:MAG: FHA domain-containing protein [Candidatus Brocadiia bacterium]